MSPDGSHDTVTPRKVARALWRRKLVCLGIAAIVLAGGAGVLLTRPKAYQSTSSVALLPITTNTNVLPNYPNLISSLIPTYIQLVASPVLLDRVAATLPFVVSPTQLVKQVHAESLSNAAVINIVAQSPSATQAQEIASRATSVFLTELSGNGVVTPHIYAEPTVPSKPSSPNIKLMLAAILALAIVLGLGAGLLWDRIFSGEESLKKLPEAPRPPVLGVVPEMVGQHGLASLFAVQDIDDTIDSAASLDGWRSLRTNFMYGTLGQQVRSVTVTSLQPGDGKTTVAVNLAASLAELGLSVVLVDAAMRDPTLHKIFGFENGKGLTSTVLDKADPATLMSAAPSIAGLRVVTAGPPLPARSDKSSLYLQQLPKFCSFADLVIVDGPPLQGDIDAALAASATDTAVLVVRSELVPLEQVDAGLLILQQYGATVLGTVLTRNSETENDGQSQHPDVSPVA